MRFCKASFHPKDFCGLRTTVRRRSGGPKTGASNGPFPAPTPPLSVLCWRIRLPMRRPNDRCVWGSDTCGRGGFGLSMFGPMPDFTQVGRYFFMLPMASWSALPQWSAQPVSGIRLYGVCLHFCTRQLTSEIGRTRRIKSKINMGEIRTRQSCLLVYIPSIPYLSCCQW